MSSKGPNCMQCKHFYITWDRDRPRGCRVYKFQSSVMPSITVRQSTGKACDAFEQKKPPESDSFDLNDEKLWGS